MIRRLKYLAFGLVALGAISLIVTPIIAPGFIAFGAVIIVFSVVPALIAVPAVVVRMLLKPATRVA